VRTWFYNNIRRYGVVVGDVWVPNPNSRRKQGKASNKNQKPAQGKPRAKKGWKATEKLVQAVFAPRLDVAKLRPSGPKLPKVTGRNKLMTQCAFKLAMAISRPWDERAIGACIPMSPAVPSRKVRAFTRFNMNLGTDNVGYVYFIPTLASDGACAIYTSGTFTLGDAISPLTANNTLNTGVLVASMGNLPYTSAQLIAPATTGSGVPGVKGRIVSYGYRVTYCGTTSNEGGVYYNYSSSTHENVSNWYTTPARLASMAECEVTGVTREPVEGCIFGVIPQEDQYSYDFVNQIAGTLNSSLSDTAILYPYGFSQLLETAWGSNNSGAGFYYTVAGSYAGSPIAVVQVQGVAAGSFLVEIVQHVEYVGELCTSDVTPNVADPEGTLKVKAAAANIPNLKNSNPTADTATLMRDALLQEFAEVAKVSISSLAKNAGAAIMSGFM
jgi:hypothetical protein